MTDDEKRRYIDYMSYKAELIDLKNHGFALSIDGRPGTPEDVALACLFGESSGYTISHDGSAYSVNYHSEADSSGKDTNGQRTSDD